MGSASHVVEFASTRRWPAIFVLAAANLGLILVVASGFSAVGDVVAPLTGHLIGFGLAAGLALIVRRWMLTLLGAGVAATLGLHAWLGLASCCRAPAPEAAGPVTRIAAEGATQRLSVLTLNTWDKLRDPRSIESYLATVPADVVILSEFGEPKGALLAGVRAIYPYQTSCADGWHCSLALLSRVPLEASGQGRIPDGGPDFVWARLGRSLTVVGTHVHRPSRNPWRHERQMAALARFLRQIDGPVVVAGDLNASPWSAAFRQLRITAGLIPTAVLLPTWPAWPVALPQAALDHILVSPDIAVVGAGTGPAVGSDHLPVWALIDYRRAAPEPAPLLLHRLISRLAAASPHLGGELLGDLGGEHVGAGNLRR